MIRKKENRQEAADHVRSKTRNQHWIDSFAEFGLTRDERTVVRLGYDGRIISPQEVWDAVGIVDTDYNRQLLESLRKKNILYRTMTPNRAFNEAKRTRTGKKRIPQFAIRNPQEIKKTKPDPKAADPTDYTIVYVGNVPFNTKEEDIAQVFSEFGEVVNVAIPSNPQTGRPRGFAFVEFSSRHSVVKALLQTGKIHLLGRRLYVQSYRGRKGPSHDART